MVRYSQEWLSHADYYSNIISVFKINIHFICYKILNLIFFSFVIEFIKSYFRK